MWSANLGTIARAAGRGTIGGLALGVGFSLGLGRYIEYRLTHGSSYPKH